MLFGETHSGVFLCLAYHCYVFEVHFYLAVALDFGHWYTMLKYTKLIFLQNLQEQDGRPRRSNFRVSLAVLLLVTSGLALPLSSFGVASASALSAPGTRSGVVSAHLAGQLDGKLVLDGVASVFVVAPPSTTGSHEVGESAVFEAQPPGGGPSAIIIFSNSSEVIATGRIHVQRLDLILGPPEEQGQGLGPSAPWSSNGAALRTGFMGEMMLAPTPPSAFSSVTAAVPKVWWDFFQRRSKFEIYVEILELMKRGPMTPFEVAFYARLNHKRTKEYTEFLAEAGYLQPVNEEGRTLYALTKEGLGFLNRVQSLLVGPGIIEVASPGYQRDF